MFTRAAIILFLISSLVAAVLIAFNPVQYFAKSRDEDKLSSVRAVGKALEAYAADNNGLYPNAGCGDSWLDCLVKANKISAVIAEGANYEEASGSAIVYAMYEADSNKANCNVLAGESAYVVYSTTFKNIGGSCLEKGAVPTASEFASGRGFDFQL